MCGDEQTGKDKKNRGTFTYQSHNYPLL